jgi:hypothetical protein
MVTSDAVNSACPDVSTQFAVPVAGLISRKAATRFPLFEGDVAGLIFVIDTPPYVHVGSVVSACHAQSAIRHRSAPDPIVTDRVTVAAKFVPWVTPGVPSRAIAMTDQHSTFKTPSRPAGSPHSRNRARRIANSLDVAFSRARARVALGSLDRLGSTAATTSRSAIALAKTARVCSIGVISVQRLDRNHCLHFELCDDRREPQSLAQQRRACRGNGVTLRAVLDAAETLGEQIERGNRRR